MEFPVHMLLLFVLLTLVWLAPMVLAIALFVMVSKQKTRIARLEGMVEGLSKRS